MEPKNFQEATFYSKWIDAMKSEIAALDANNTWSIVDLPPGKYYIGYKWDFKDKYLSFKDVERYKAIFVAKGFAHGLII